MDASISKGVRYPERVTLQQQNRQVGTPGASYLVVFTKKTMYNNLMDTTNPHIINLLPGTMIDDFFVFGFLAGVVGYAWYLYSSRNDPKNHLNWVIGVYGTILSGAMGGLLAIVFDKNIGVSIVVGLLNQLIYMALIRSAKSGDFWKVIKEVLIRYLSGGSKP